MDKYELSREDYVWGGRSGVGRRHTAEVPCRRADPRRNYRPLELDGDFTAGPLLPPG